MQNPQLFFTDRYNNTIAVETTPAKSELGLVYLTGYRSNKDAKKTFVAQELCLQYKLAFMKFDYYGHGKSDGSLEQVTLGRCFSTAEDAILFFNKKKIILVASSMGVWVALLLAKKYKNKIAGIIAISSAVDFTEELIINKLTATEKAEIKKIGFWENRPTNHYFTYNFLIEARKHLIFNKNLDLTCPIYIIHGLHDIIINYEYAIKLAKLIPHQDVKVILTKSDHSYCSEQDLVTLKKILQEFYLNYFTG